MIRTSRQNYFVSTGRIKFAAFFLFLFALGAIGKLAWLQIIRTGEITADAAQQHSTLRALPAQRGVIYYGDIKSPELYPVAANRIFYHLYAAPKDIQDSQKTLDLLWPLLESSGLSRETLTARL